MAPAGGTCPLCQQDNHCEIARTGRADAPCWCREVRIAADILRRVPESARTGSDCACLCRKCTMA